MPVGTFLSGGIDSSAVTALLSESGRRPATFSVCFAEAGYDESAFSRAVARRFQADHTEIRLSEAEILDMIPDAVARLDQPSSDGVNTYLVSRAVRSRGIKVALSGLGAYEIFGGYPSFRRLKRYGRALSNLRRVPPILRTAVSRAISPAGTFSAPSAKISGILRSGGRPFDAYLTFRQLFSSDQRSALLSDKLRARLPNPSEPYESWRSRNGFSPEGLLAQVSLWETGTYMHDVLLRDTDQMSMSHALEVRVPYLDHPLAEYVVSL